MSQYVLRQRETDDEEILARQAFQPGLYLYGYCGGLFGRDAYGPNLILEIKGNDIIVKDENGNIMIGTIDGNLFTWKELLQDSNYDCNNPDY